MRPKACKRLRSHLYAPFVAAIFGVLSVHYATPSPPPLCKHTTHHTLAKIQADSVLSYTFGLVSLCTIRLLDKSFFAPRFLPMSLCVCLSLPLCLFPSLPRSLPPTLPPSPSASLPPPLYAYRHGGAEEPKVFGMRTHIY